MDHLTFFRLKIRNPNLVLWTASKLVMKIRIAVWGESRQQWLSVPHLVIWLRSMHFLFILISSAVISNSVNQEKRSNEYYMNHLLCGQLLCSMIALSLTWKFTESTLLGQMTVQKSCTDMRGISSYYIHLGRNMKRQKNWGSMIPFRWLIRFSFNISLGNFFRLKLFLINL